ncbi:MAG: hypothetical protein KJO51_05885 [Gramella sp.]|nr:hypothetical protein [Christiangramia sp.]
MGIFREHRTIGYRSIFSLPEFMKRPETAFYAGVFLMLFPAFFFTGLIFSHYLQIDAGMFSTLYEWTIDRDRQYGDTSFFNWLLRFLILGAPVLALLLNLLTLQFKKLIKGTIAADHKKNLVIVCIGGFLVLFFSGYLLMENLLS